jgi:DNA-binding XRE family transcriptional regulator
MTESVESRFIKSDCATKELARLAADDHKMAKLNLSVEVPFREVERVATALEGALLISEGLFLSSEAGTKRHLTKSSYSVISDGHELPLSKSNGLVLIGSPGSKPKKETPRMVNEYGEELLTADEVFPEAHPSMTLKGFRLRDEMNQRELAKLLGIPQPRVSALETGKRQISREMAKRLGEIFEIPYKVFL